MTVGKMTSQEELNEYIETLSEREKWFYAINEDEMFIDSTSIGRLGIYGQLAYEV
ncbi:hypothetical protein [Vagococcus bubulae]|uniref:hypothetical protein n=1 Tax=Vagococcus bubulae TaxID=1977868 RepID=UPI001403841E|nr:hypothetical protein [Vagococcus bubulae]